MLRVVHVITGLDTGGAETMLSRLVLALDPREIASEVVSLTSVGVVGERIRAGGVDVTALGMRRGVPDPRALVRLARHLRARRPDVVQTWMYHADLLGGVAARLARTGPVAWGVRTSVLDPAITGRLSQATVRACVALARIVPARIVFNSETGRRVHLALGYPDDRAIVIPNGFDPRAFRPDAEARAAVRAELGVGEATPLVGLVARFDVFKDQRTFVRAAARVAARRPDARFLMCGDGIGWDNATLAGWINESGCPRDRFLLLGRRRDVPRVTAALDVATTSSVTEGFPNVVGEAMACAVPCAVTDVGDSAFLVADTGRVVPHGDPAALAGAVEALLALPPAGRAALGAAARRRIEEHFSLDAVARRFAALYGELAGRELAGR